MLPAIGSFLMIAGLSAAARGPAVWLDVPFVRQEKDGCGAASASMVMQYWIREGFLGIPAADAQPLRAYAELRSSRAKGTMASDLERFLDERGFRTFSFPGRMDDLSRHLAKGRPLIVCLKPGGEETRHFLVVAGVDEDFVFVNDPARRKLSKHKREEFETEWKAGDSWTLLALPAAER